MDANSVIVSNLRAFTRLSADQANVNLSTSRLSKLPSSASNLAIAIKIVVAFKFDVGSTYRSFEVS